MSPTAFGASLYGLWLAANDSLPQIAERYTNANRVIAGGSDDRSAFGHTVRVSPTSSITTSTTATSRVFSHWDGLRDALQQALAQSSNYTFEAAEALLKVMNNYATSDAEAKRAMDGSITAARNGQPPAPGAPPGAPAQETEQRAIRDYDFSHRSRATGRT